jgi:hypothetical protein
VTFADAPPGAHAGAVSYGPVLNAAAVLLTAYGNVPPERAARLTGMLLGADVSAGWVDKASSRRRWPPTRPRSASWTRPHRPQCRRKRRRTRRRRTALQPPGPRTC